MKSRSNFWTVALIIFTVLLAVSCRARSGNAAGGRTAAFLRIFESGNFHMNAKMIDDGAEVPLEIYARGDMISFSMASQGESFRLIQRDDRAYAIIDSLRMVMVMPSIHAPDMDIVGLGGLTTDQMRFVNSGTAIFDGRNLPYDEYINPDGETMQLFIDGNRFAGIRSITEGGEPNDLIILEFTQNFPDSVFDIPSDYQIQEMP